MTVAVLPALSLPVQVTLRVPTVLLATVPQPLVASPESAPAALAATLTAAPRTTGFGVTTGTVPEVSWGETDRPLTTSRTN